MGFREMGSQETDVPKTPTLRKWIKDNEDLDIWSSLVKVVFIPGKYASYTFVTEADFKVVVERSSQLEKYLLATLEDAINENVCLYIQIKNKEKGSWALSALENNEVEWEVYSWGFKAGKVTATKPDSKKTARRNSRASRTQSEDRSDHTVEDPLATQLALKDLVELPV